LYYKCKKETGVELKPIRMSSRMTVVANMTYCSEDNFFGEKHFG